MPTLCCKYKIIHNDQLKCKGHTQYPQMSTDGQVSCPYCESKFKDKNELSKHIDRIHSDSGLLEGDKRQW